MSSEEIWRLTAQDLAKATTRGDITAEAATKASIDRMREVNPALNAVVIDLSEQALEQARQLDIDKANGKNIGPLHGLPVTIKINVDQAGCATSNGLPALQNEIAKVDAPVVMNLQNAGAIVIGRTNTPEFSFRADTDNPLHGRTHNPWGKHISAGGSSGGAASAVMAGIGALGHGNDIGGSLRFPASANGAVTVKPSLGRVPAWNPSQKAERGMLAQSMSVQGLLARSAADLELAIPSLVLADARDPFHVPLPYRIAPKSTNLCVGFCKETPGFNTHPEVYKALDIAAGALRDAGYEVQEIHLPFLQDTGEIAYRALMGEVVELMGPDIRANGSDAIQAIFDEYYRQFQPFEGTELLQMMAKRTYFAREWSLLMQEYPLILSPFLPQPFFAPGRDEEGPAGVREVLGSALWSYSINFIGLPAGNIPTRLSKLERGVQPINVQIIGQRWREDAIVDAMISIEERVGTMAQHLWALMQED
ncbi:MAG: amidase family protein [Paracoccaceae bacterium]|nr:amidase family protein [Paracoccaceae bacterium]